MAKKANPNHFGYAVAENEQIETPTFEKVQSMCEAKGMSVDEVAQCLNELGLTGDCGSLYGSKLILFNNQCRIPKVAREGLAKGKWRSVDYTFYDTVAVGGESSVEFFPIGATTGARSVGVRNIEKGHIAEKEQGSLACMKIRLLYGVDTSVTPQPYNAFYGRELDTNIAAGTPKYRSVDFPPQIRNGEFTFTVADTKLWEFNPLSRFDTTGRSNDLVLGEILLDNPLIINGGERLEMKLIFPDAVVAPSTGEAYLRIELIGSYASPFGKQ